jgi:threonine dehydrogenase-like Zn-dependent dehydrogenase
MAKMQRLVKLEGFGNVQMAQADVPVPRPDEVLVRLSHSLISRGSELFRRYVLEEAVSPSMMGYSAAGEVVEAGSAVTGIQPGDRAMVVAPHAQYGTGSPHGVAPTAFVLPPDLDDETATFLPLSISAVQWMRHTPMDEGDTVVVMGQGLVGLLCAQAVRERRPGRVIAVDAYELRCRIAGECGADEVINVSDTDPVEAVMDRTGGVGADVVIECVGGTAGVESFKQAQRMTRAGGVIHLIAKYQAGDGVAGSGVLPLDSDVMMNKRLVAGVPSREPPPSPVEDAARILVDGRIQVEPIITHRLSWQQAPDAYHMLYHEPARALGVVLGWDE